MKTIKQNFNKGIFPLIGIGVGIIIIIMAFLIRQPEISTVYTYSSSFGADFYTYEYQATMNAANNVAETGEAICKAIVICARFILIAMGLIDIVYFLNLYIRSKSCVTETEVSVPVASDIKICKNCGNELGENDRFCQKCGEEIKDEIEPEEVEEAEDNVLS